jgi:FKBP-type peptidyl-prolyl cis-trans isomerase FklB
MKKFLYSSILLLGVFGFTSCTESDSTTEEFGDWQNRNETYFSDIYQKAKADTVNYKIIRSWSLEKDMATSPENNIVVQVLKVGTGSGCPLYTDSVRVHYEGRLIPSATYTGGYVFDKTWSGEYNLATMHPTTMSVSGLIDGMVTALMKMHIGDRWKVYIPYQLGYGTTTSSSTSIPGYSTLIFDLTLSSYYRMDTTVPDDQAKPFTGWVDD